MAVKGSRAKSREKAYKVAGSTFFAIFFAAVVSFLYFQFNKEPGLDKITLCPATGPKGHYILLVDKTDPLNFTQKQAFSILLGDIVKKRTKEGYLLSVFALGEDFKENAEPLIELCNPGSGENNSELTSNVKRERRNYEEKFIEPLLKQNEALQTSQPGKNSPIFEMLQLVAINGFRKHDVQGEKRLFIMSDMLHNANEFSMYRTAPDYADFAETAYGRKTQLDLRGVSVELYYLLNTPQFQTRRNLLFWENYFTKSGARLAEVRPLEG